MNKIWKVYMHTNNINGKKYIGITHQEVYRRFLNGKGYSHSKKFNNAIKKYGWESFSHTILEDNILTLDEANKKEMYYINKYDTFNNGYNSTLGGDGVLGHTGWNKGKHLSEEHKKKISESNKGKKITLETRNKISKANKGKSHKPSEKQIESARNRFIGNKYWLGKHHSEESILKMRKVRPNRKRIVQYTMNGLEIKKFDSIADASRELNINPTCIIKVCKGIMNKTHNYIFKYEEV